MVQPQQQQHHQYRRHAVITSRVLVTRKPPQAPRSRSRTRDTERSNSSDKTTTNHNHNNNNFWVLGWVTLSPISLTKGDDDCNSNNNNDKNDIHGSNKFRETIVVAGFLPIDRPLIEYQNSIERLKNSSANEIDVVVSENAVRSSTYLTDSLQILAIWTTRTSTTSTTDTKRKNTVTKDQFHDDTSPDSLPILNNQRGYPWWYERSEVQQSISSKVSPSTSQTQHNQVVFYELDDDNKVGRQVSLDSYKSGFADSNGTEWSLMIHRINHSNEILAIVQTGRVPERVGNCIGQQPIVATKTKRIVQSGPNLAGIESIETHNVQDGVPSESSTSLLCRIQQLVVKNSLTILHFRHLHSISSSASTRTSLSTSLSMSTNSTMRRYHPFFSCLSVYRFSVATYELSTFTTNSRSYICTLTNKLCLIPSRRILAQQRTARWNAFLSTTIDMVLGFVLCGILLLLYWYITSIGKIHLAGNIRIFDVLKRQIGWLETFPAGFKLNVQLTHNMGYEIQNLLYQQERLLLLTLWNPILYQQYGIPVLAVLAAGCGWTTALAIVIDLWRLENIHLIILTTAFRKLYSVELYLLSGLFRLFRGKKRNPLRQRTDTMHYDAMQLLVGTVGFCICIFLWTTIMVYYTFFVLWNLVMHLPVLLLWSMYSLSLSLPWGSILLRTVHPGWFPKDVYIGFLGRDSFAISSSSSPSSSNHETANCNDTINHVVQITELVSIPESVIHILNKRICVHLKGILKWFFDASFEVVYPRSSNLSPTTIPLADWVKNLVPWEKMEVTAATKRNGNRIGNNIGDPVDVTKSKND
jgi:hypothetical protein